MNKNNNQFADYWKLEKGEMTIEKFANDRLSKSDLLQVQQVIATLQKKGLPSSKIITALQKMNAKLAERWKAERVYYTEVKAQDTAIVIDASQELDISKYRCVLSPNACKICIEKTDDGKKIFKNSDIKKGEGHIPPFHPNCYCIFLPVD